MDSRRKSSLEEETLLEAPPTVKEKPNSLATKRALDYAESDT